MSYKVYLYSTTATTRTAPAIRLINIAVRTNLEREWKGNCCADYMKHFDADAVVKSITEALPDKCTAKVCYSPGKYKKKEYILVNMPFENAIEVLSVLHATAVKNDLVLYDAKTNKSFFRELADSTYITMHMRRNELNSMILKEMKPVWKIRRLEFFMGKRDKGCSYAVTIRKDKNTSFEERNRLFYNCLKNSLHKNEKLTCKNQCYTISAEWYTITYVLEGYKKQADKIGYVENGVPCVSLMHRMSIEKAFRLIKESKINKYHIYTQMLYSEMNEAYPNPAQRFVKCLKITKELLKLPFDVSYGCSYGSGIVFSIVPPRYYDDTYYLSVLDIEEDSATFILPFVYEKYPYIYENYYGENHLPYQMWEEIVKRIEKTKKMILYDTFNPKLEKYLEKFDLYLLAENQPGCRKSDSVADRKQLLFEHRYEVAKLYDIFIKWSRAQLDSYCCSDSIMLSITGP